MKLKFFTCTLCLSLLLCGCSSSLLTPEPLNDTWADLGYAKIGHSLTIENSDNRFTLLENRDTLSSDGLYYVTWTIGDSIPFENSDGDTVDLYDAHLYLLLGEYSSPDRASENMGKWLATGKNNYEVLAEEEITCNGQTYTMISYNFNGADNPYAKGVSFFGACNKSAVCIELTCRENFTEDLKEIMIQFLEHCTFESN